MKILALPSIIDTAGHLRSVLRSELLLQSLVLMLITPCSLAAIVNNNHVYQLSDTMNQKVVALTKSKGKSLPEVDLPIFLDKLPIHLYAKSLDVYDQIKRLNASSQLEEKQLPFKTLRPKDVFDLLEEASTALDKELLAAGLDPAGYEVELPLGKSSADAYQNLWLLTYHLALLVPPPDMADTLAQIQRIEDEIKIVAKNKSLNFQPSASKSAQDKKVRDVILVMYQDMHLLGRLQRKLGTEAIIPGTPRSGELKITDIYDTARTTLADIHRMKIVMNIEESAPVNTSVSSASMNDLYAKSRSIHDLLLHLSDGSS